MLPAATSGVWEDGVSRKASEAAAISGSGLQLPARQPDPGQTRPEELGRFEPAEGKSFHDGHSWTEA